VCPDPVAPSPKFQEYVRGSLSGSDAPSAVKLRLVIPAMTWPAGVTPMVPATGAAFAASASPPLPPAMSATAPPTTANAPPPTSAFLLLDQPSPDDSATAVVAAGDGAVEARVISTLVVTPAP